MSVDAGALGEDVEATRMSAQPFKASLIPASGDDTGATVDPDSTKEPPAPAGLSGGALEQAKPYNPSDRYSGRVLGNRYRLEEVLGAGGMGVVYRACDLQVQGEVFAIKVLKPKLQGHRELVRCLRDEVRKTRLLSHPNIVSAYSINSDEDGDYMLMEYLEGETLQKLLDEEFGRGIPFARAWPLIMDICSGLAYAHDHNVIHSDLKPLNVFVTTAGRVKLLDFGIARVARGPIRGFDAAAHGAATETYASCEMLERGTPDVRDDVYALGCVVYEMLSGKHPFAKRSATDARDLKLQPAPLACLSRRQNASLAKALCFDRDQRTASVEAFQSELEPRSALAPGRAIAFGLVGVVVLAGILLAGRAWLDRPSAPAATPGAAPTAAPTATPAAPPASTPASSLAAAQSLSRLATVLNVDADDSRLKAGVGALAEAQSKIRRGEQPQAKAYIDQAEGSLKEAIRLSPRIATVGSTPAEIEAATQLCRRETGDSADCVPSVFADETARKVSLRPFALDKLPATNVEFAQFARQTGYLTAAERSNGLYAAAETAVLLPGSSWRTLRDKESSADSDPAGYPVRGIDYAAAKAYCAWRGKRLPSEDEWEFVARGPSRKIFSWGDKPSDAPSAQARQLSPVEKLPSTGSFGSRGQGGLVWEWTEGVSEARPILRGPSYLVNLTFYQRLATRERENPIHARVDTGVRCALSTEAWPDVPASSSLAR
jgi:formylglycine-generating enzyme required for sulfatase activity